MQLNKAIIINLPRPIKTIWSYIWQWIKTWFWVLLLTITTWPVFIPLVILIYDPQEGSSIFWLFDTREFKIFSYSLIFSDWFWIGFLCLKRFVKVWQKVLAIMLFLLLNYTVYGMDYIADVFPVIIGCIVFSWLLYASWHKYGSKVREKDLFKKVFHKIILIVKKIVIVVLVIIGVNFLIFSLGLFPSAESVFQKLVNYFLVLIAVFISYTIFKKQFTRTITYILTVLLIVSIVSRSIFCFWCSIIFLTLSIIMIFVAVYDGIVEIKKIKKKVLTLPIDLG